MQIPGFHPRSIGPHSLRLRHGSLHKNRQTTTTTKQNENTPPNDPHYKVILGNFPNFYLLKGPYLTNQISLQLANDLILVATPAKLLGEDRRVHRIKFNSTILCWSILHLGLCWSKVFSKTSLHLCLHTRPFQRRPISRYSYPFIFPVQNLE